MATALQKILKVVGSDKTKSEQNADLQALIKRDQACRRLLEKKSEWVTRLKDDYGVKYNPKCGQEAFDMYADLSYVCTNGYELYFCFIEKEYPADVAKSTYYYKRAWVLQQLMNFVTTLRNNQIWVGGLKYTRVTVAVDRWSLGIPGGPIQSRPVGKINQIVNNLGGVPMPIQIEPDSMMSSFASLLMGMQLTLIEFWSDLVYDPRGANDSDQAKLAPASQVLLYSPPDSGLELPCFVVGTAYYVISRQFMNQPETYAIIEQDSDQGKRIKSCLSSTYELNDL